MKTLRMVCLCAATACSLSAQIPAPTLYYPLDGSLPPITGVMPVSGAGVFRPGQSGFGSCVTNTSTQLRAPDTYHVGAEPSGRLSIVYSADEVSIETGRIWSSHALKHRV